MRITPAGLPESLECVPWNAYIYAVFSFAESRALGEHILGLCIVEHNNGDCLST